MKERLRKSANPRHLAKLHLIYITKVGWRENGNKHIQDELLLQKLWELFL